MLGGDKSKVNQHKACGGGGGGGGVEELLMGWRVGVPDANSFSFI